jgi:hypothetical protein
MLLPKIKIKKNHQLIAYKLLIDAIFITLVFFAFALMAEGILPGIITMHVGFSNMVIFLGLSILASYFIAKSTATVIKSQIFNKKIASVGLFIISLLIFNSLIRLNLLLGFITLTLIVITEYFIYKVILEEND